jgi:hypothetical protein
MKYAMKKKLVLTFSALLLLSTHLLAQATRKVEGPRWRAGLNIHMASSFKNVRVDYPGLGYTGVLGGATGRGVEIFGGYKIHNYLSLELHGGLLLNSYSRTYNYSLYITGRFNKFYAQPCLKFIYPIIQKNFTDINLFLGGGVGIHGSGRFYLESDFGNNDRDIIYMKYDPMIAPFATVGAELLFGDRNNIVIGFKYQNGVYEGNRYYVSYDPSANINNAPAELKRLNAEGIGFTIGFIRLF